ncbi:tyrosine-type recombinase/integrase [Arcicella sp. DC2W]|uniref:Tyrosine-type recombinase/integrase n=1 Tax=Arcicella gelida TaxID=2984195 RepID=A0ABU5S249_9BACT|nr:tyrosine-type recombinase/integrase [Arcicella sp. DC2W]MEA5402550.1 tyrosine-type recombinase/integrase [Arcicella sp. DC2W]
MSHKKAPYLLGIDSGRNGSINLVKQMNKAKLAVSSNKVKKRTSTFTVTFRERENASSVSINARLSYDGKTFDKFTGIKCNRGEFKNGQVKGNPEINSLLKSYENNLHNAFVRLKDRGEGIDLQRIAICMFGASVVAEAPKLLDAIDRYLQAYYFDKGNDFSKITKAKNKRYGNHLKQWAKSFFGREGIALAEIKPAHELEIIKYMKSQRQSQHNYATMHVQWLKRVYDFAIANEWVLRNPFMGFSPRYDKVKIMYLTQKEVKRLEELKLSKGSLYDRVRDFFLFSCYTGLSYMDLVNVSSSHIKTDDDGFKYLEIPRLKTDVIAIIPLLRKPLEIIEKYGTGDNQEKLFTVPTNQAVNRTLKELAEIAELSIKPNFHLARKTCATLLMSEGIQATIVQRVLGHSSLSTTLNHYGKIEAKPIIDSFKNKFKND